MSRIGKIPVAIPKGIELDLKDNFFIVSNNKNSLSQSYDSSLIEIKKEENIVSILRKNDTKKAKSFHGLYRQLLNNMVEGLSKGFSKSLLINGTGYRAEIKGKILLLTLGYSTQFEYMIPEDIMIDLEGQTKINIKGFSKVLVGQVAAEIRSLRPVEPYKGKGIRYSNEVVKLKEGKSGVK